MINVKKSVLDKGEQKLLGEASNSSGGKRRSENT